MAHDAEIREYTGDSGRVSAVLREAQVAAVHMAALGAEVLAAAPELRLAACARSGAVNVNLDAATRRGVVVCNAPGRNARAVAEFTVALIIDVTKGVARGHRALTGAASWRADLYRYDTVGEDLASLTVGLLGMGSIGRLLAPLLNAFGARVLACDPYVPAQVFAAASGGIVRPRGAVGARRRGDSARPPPPRHGAAARRARTGTDAPRRLPDPDCAQPATRLRRPGAGTGGRPARRRGNRRVPGGAAARRPPAAGAAQRHPYPAHRRRLARQRPHRRAHGGRQLSPPGCAEKRRRTA